MAEKSTFIKIDRNITEWGWYQDGNTFRVFMHLLIKASIKDREYAGIILKRGEYITTYDRISTELKLSIQQARTALEHLKLTGEITITRHSKFQVISIKNYDFYQSNYENQQSNNNQITINQQSDNSQSTINQQSNNNQITIKQECKERKEEKECKESKEWEEGSAAKPPQPPAPEKKKKEVKHKYGEYSHVRLTDMQYSKLIEEYGESRIKLYIKKVDEYCQQHGKSYKDYNLTIRNWMNKDNVQKVNGQSKSVYDEYEESQELPF
jgi:DNA replication protein DnaD